uniref:Large ribosomal subunit protein eL22 n=1 Tax=Ditylenchus dipsaci TaxID=166011 RepID=A0A915CMC7_9BILA
MSRSRRQKKKKQVLRGSSTLQFHIECKNPVEDGILKINSSYVFLPFKMCCLEKFLNEQIKVGGKKKQLAANGVQVEAAKTKISVSSNNAFSKRYLKYLTKKYLKRNSLRDWLRLWQAPRTRMSCDISRSIRRTRKTVKMRPSSFAFIQIFDKAGTMMIPFLLYWSDMQFLFSTWNGSWTVVFLDRSCFPSFSCYVCYRLYVLTVALVGMVSSQAVIMVCLDLLMSSVSAVGTGKSTSPTAVITTIPGAIEWKNQMV